MRSWNPAGIAAPPPRASPPAPRTPAPARWLVLQGQPGRLPDGRPATGLAAQLDTAFASIEVALSDAGLTRADLIKLTIRLADPSVEAVITCRQRREMWTGMARRPAITLLIVKGLAEPQFLCEIEAVAIL